MSRVEACGPAEDCLVAVYESWAGEQGSGELAVAVAMAPGHQGNEVASTSIGWVVVTAVDVEIYCAVLQAAEASGIRTRVCWLVIRMYDAKCRKQVAESHQHLMRSSSTGQDKRQWSGSARLALSGGRGSGGMGNYGQERAKSWLKFCPQS